MFKEQCYLHRSFNPKVVTYTPDGFGRDTYINFNNGGFLKGGAKEIRKEQQYEVTRNTHFYHIK